MPDETPEEAARRIVREYFRDKEQKPKPFDIEQAINRFLTGYELIAFLIRLLTDNAED